MNRTAIFLATIIMPLLSARSEPAKIQLAKVDLIVAAPSRKVFRIEAGEVTVGGNVIKRVEFGKSTAVITYLNKTAEVVAPNYRYRLFDAYGIEIASFNEQNYGGGGRIMPGETDTRKMGFGINKLNELIEFSTVALPTDWATPVYLVIEDGPQPAPHPFPQPPR